MALRNPSFEDAGVLPGEAEHWTLTAVTSLEVLAGFGAAPEDAWEDFERWHALLDSLDDVVVVLAFITASAFAGLLEHVPEVDVPTHVTVARREETRTHGRFSCCFFVSCRACSSACDPCAGGIDSGS